jgi:hypothetical protein
MGMNGDGFNQIEPDKTEQTKSDKQNRSNIIGNWMDGWMSDGIVMDSDGQRLQWTVTATTL